MRDHLNVNFIADEIINKFIIILKPTCFYLLTRKAAASQAKF